MRRLLPVLILPALILILAILPAQAALFGKAPEKSAAEAAAANLSAVTIWIDASWGFRNQGAAQHFAGNGAWQGVTEFNLFGDFVVGEFFPAIADYLSGCQGYIRLAHDVGFEYFAPGGVGNGGGSIHRYCWYVFFSGDC